jgi:hypothetical protein
VFSPHYEQQMAESIAAPRAPRSKAPADPFAHPSDVVLRGGFAVSVAFALGLAVVAIPLPQGGHVDTSVLLALNHLFAVLPFKELQFAAAELNLAQVVLAAGIVILWTARRNRRHARDFVLLAVGAAIVVYAISGAAYLFARRPRPFFEVTLQPLVDPATLHQLQQTISPLGPVLSDQAGIFALATLLAFVVSRRAGLIVAVVGTWSVLYRISTGLDWPSDALGGAMFGTAAGVCAIRFRSAFEPWFTQVRELFRRYPATANAIAFVALADFALGFPILKGLAEAIFRASP